MRWVDQSQLFPGCSPMMRRKVLIDYKLFNKKVNSYRTKKNIYIYILLLIGINVLLLLLLCDTKKRNAKIIVYIYIDIEITRYCVENKIYSISIRIYYFLDLWFYNQNPPHRAPVPPIGPAYWTIPIGKIWKENPGVPAAVEEHTFLWGLRHVLVVVRQHSSLLILHFFGCILVTGLQGRSCSSSSRT